MRQGHGRLLQRAQHTPLRGSGVECVWWCTVTHVHRLKCACQKTVEPLTQGVFQSEVSAWWLALRKQPGATTYQTMSSQFGISKVLLCILLCCTAKMEGSIFLFKFSQNWTFNVVVNVEWVIYISFKPLIFYRQVLSSRAARTSVCIQVCYCCSL